MVQKLPTPEGQDKITSSSPIVANYLLGFMVLFEVNNGYTIARLDGEREAGAEMVAADSLT